MSDMVDRFMKKRRERHRQLRFLCGPGCDCGAVGDVIQIADAAAEMTPAGDDVPYDGSHVLTEGGRKMRGNAVDLLSYRLTKQHGAE